MKLTKDFKKVSYDTRRHIQQKTPADCKLSSIAMYFNLSWETIVDLYSQVVLGAITSLPGPNIDKNDPDYYDKLFNQCFYDLSSGFAGMDYLTTGWLFDILGSKRFVELPFLIKGVPCLVSTTPVSVKDPTAPCGYYFEGHAIYFDGYFLYDPNWDASDPNFEGRMESSLALRFLPPFTTFYYLLDEMKNSEKFLELADSLKRSFWKHSGNDIKEYHSKVDFILSGFHIIDTPDNFGAFMQSSNLLKDDPNSLIVAKKQVLDLDPSEWDNIFFNDDDDKSYKNMDASIIALPPLPIADINKFYADTNTRLLINDKPLLKEYPDKEFEWYMENTDLYSNYSSSDTLWEEFLTISEVKDKLSKSNKKARSLNDEIFKRKVKSNPFRRNNPYSIKPNPISYIHKIQECTDFNYYEIIAYDGSIEVGHYIFVLHLSPKKKLIVEDSFTHPVYRRRGVATKAYDYIENLTGMKITPVPDEQTEEASLFWKKRQSMKPNPVTSKRTNEKLWEKVKKEAVNKMGGHSARAMQYAVKLYKDRGGKYIGQKRADNDLATWTRAKWQYAPDSKSKDRYLPKEAWKKLSKEEIRATRKKKKGKMGEWVENTEKAKRAAREATNKARRKNA
jgi:GNAT superfamily N-acetyltransferase